ncbi:hypothetical protein PTE31013_01563 [Pandoraea terrigena]|uniref:Uncharacterized protein n=1 Tax=Pandoraea terrigena TaxID=2508292 RepID=A0A5E4TSU3_9BURK|nr:hypothetical protein PTE31013_01563 [Pandoraea terrigena]
MLTSLTLDDELLAKAKALAGASMHDGIDQ